MGNTVSPMLAPNWEIFAEIPLLALERKIMKCFLIHLQLQKTKMAVWGWTDFFFKTIHYNGAVMKCVSIAVNISHIFSIKRKVGNMYKQHTDVWINHPLFYIIQSFL